MSALHLILTLIAFSQCVQGTDEHTGKYAGGGIGAFLFISLGLLLCYFFQKKSRQTEDGREENDEQEENDLETEQPPPTGWRKFRKWRRRNNYRQFGVEEGGRGRGWGRGRGRGCGRGRGRENNRGNPNTFPENNEASPPFATQTIINNVPHVPSQIHNPQSTMAEVGRGKGRGRGRGNKRADPNTPHSQNQQPSTIFNQTIINNVTQVPTIPPPTQMPSAPPPRPEGFGGPPPPYEF